MYTDNVRNFVDDNRLVAKGGGHNINTVEKLKILKDFILYYNLYFNNVV